MTSYTQQDQEFQEIADFLVGLKFKKSFLGANTADVYACMQDLDAMYRDCLADIKNGQAEELEHLRQELEDSRGKQEELQQAADLHVQEQAQMKAELEEAQARCQKLEQMETGASTEDYHEKTELLAQAMLDIQKSSNAIIEQAEREKITILAEARHEADQLYTARVAEIDQRERDARLRVAELSQTQLLLQQNLAKIHEELQLLTARLGEARKTVGSEKSSAGDYSPGSLKVVDDKAPLRYGNL